VADRGEAGSTSGVAFSQCKERRLGKCSSEPALGEKAKHRLVEILNSGAVEASPFGGRDEDGYGRIAMLPRALTSGGFVGQGSPAW